MKISINSNIFNPVYIPTYADKKRYLVLYGGAGSGKSFWIAQQQLLRLMNEKGHRFLNVRKVASTIRKSQFALLKDIIISWKISHLFTINKSDMVITYNPNKNSIVHAGLDDVEKLKSIHGITGIWAEEASELSRNEFIQLDLRLRGITNNYKQIIVSFNPIDEHLFLRTYFDDKKNDTTVLHTTYKDNKFLDNSYINMIEKLANEDLTYYKIYTKGEYATPTSIIYQRPIIIINEYRNYLEYDHLIYGIDFGFNNPSAVLRIGSKDLNFEEKEIIHQTHLTNSDLIDKMNELIPQEEKECATFYADCAEPDRIEEIIRAGYNCYPCIKGPGSVKMRIDFCKRYNYSATSDNENLIKGHKGYKWKEDRNGNVLDEPVKFMDHLMDCRGYAIYTHFKDIVGVSGTELDDIIENLNKSKDLVSANQEW